LSRIVGVFVKDRRIEIILFTYLLTYLLSQYTVNSLLLKQGPSAEKRDIVHPRHHSTHTSTHV